MKEYFLYPICKILDCVIPGKYKIGAPVLLYHSISKKDSRLAVSPENFNKQMHYLRKMGYNTISPRDLFNESRNGRDILITFDDGFKDNLTNALSILQKYNFKATVFITTKYIGSESIFLTNNSEKNYKMLNNEEIKKLENENWSICNHLHSHINLTELSDEEIRGEYIKSREILGGIINKKENVSIMAYPRNKKNKKVVNILKEAGIKMAFSGAAGMVNKNSDIMDLPRIEIYNNTSFIKYTLYLSPSFQFFKNKKFLWQKRKF